MAASAPRSAPRAASGWRAPQAAEGQAGGGGRGACQKLLGTPEGAENVSLRLGFCHSLAPLQPQLQQQSRARQRDAEFSLLWVDGAVKYCSVSTAC